jgi:tetratricopeptide (TPR) repeat protein
MDPIPEPDVIRMQPARKGITAAAGEDGQTATVATLTQLGRTAYEQGRLPEAVRYFQQLVALNPQSADGHNCLGIALQATNRLVEAIASFRRAIALNARLAEAHSNLGLALSAAGAFEEADFHCRAALQLEPSSADAFNNLGVVLAQHGRAEEAGQCFREALRLDLAAINARNNLGNYLQEKGQFAEARREYEAVLQLNPRLGSTWYSLVNTKHYTIADHGEIAQLEELLEDASLSLDDRSRLNFALGKICDDCGLYAKAFRHVQRANDLLRGRWDREGFAASIDQLMAFFPAGRFSSPGERSEAPPAPVFIIGMPRSGTSLVEQILASHPEVHGCGELKDIENLTSWLPSLPGMVRWYPGCMTQVPDSLCRRMADWYLDRRRAFCRDARLVTDKMPTNFLHLGLVALLFPEARVIHCCRDPLDVGLSCYFQNFALRPLYSFDLGDIGHFHRQYQRIMAHWRTVLPLPILDVSYEELIADLKGGVRRLLQFLDLEWEPRCLRFHENDRPVQTASGWQVRQPVYQSAVGRWKKYAPQLEPLRQALQGQGETGSLRPFLEGAG